MAIIRNAVISLLNHAGYHNIAQGRRAAAWTETDSHSTSSGFDQEHIV